MIEIQNNKNTKKDSAQEDSNISENDLEKLKETKILLVEDNHANQVLVMEILRDCNIEVDIAINGEEAIEKYNLNSYNLILMDIHMPLMNGLEATKQIRKKDKSIPIIALTANSMPNEIDEIKHAKMNDYINKPIDFEKFKNILLKYTYLTTSKKNETQKNLEGFKNLDTNEALANINNNYKLYIEILREFYNSYKIFNIDKLSGEDFIIQIHTLKSLSGTIGAKKLFAITKDIEKTKDKKNLPLVYDELNNILSEIKDII